MDVADLKTLAAVARHGSMNKAASELHTVQSNVTARIRALEDELGVPLFQRHARGVTITPAGQRMLPFVGRIAKLLAEARAAARDDGSPAGALALGGLETTTALRLSPLLIEFARAYPQVTLSLGTGTTTALLRDVVECRLDGAFVSGPVDHPDIHQETIFTEELVLATSPAIRSLKDLAKVADLKTVVFNVGCSYRQRLETLLAGMGIVVARPLEFGSLDAILSCTAAGVGVTLLPRGVVQSAFEAGRIALHRLPREQARAETLFIRRTDGYVSSALTAFLDIARRFHRVPEKDRAPVPISTLAPLKRA
ncbi:LysR family transcriptional regulator [Bordetella bronchialis]|uniref:Transcriptional regulator n=1 Tax=Bordetella bronchialis TaxID=463025 RepID=A0ABN4R7Q0_9BORD|nr:LysR family transcriptional regulator [Bordetella bronchialis]ANN67541.1 transcriptional regulator [Bordetella bronchialis]